MVAVTITLSEDDLSLAHQQAAKRGFSGIEDFLRGLVTERLRESPNEDYGAPERLCVTSKEQLTKLCLEALDTPIRPITSEDFVAMRRELTERYGPRKV